jgi:hypothetical protein
LGSDLPRRIRCNRRGSAAAPDLASASIALNTSIAAAILLALTWQRGAR